VGPWARLLAPFIPYVIGRSLRRGLAGAYVRGDVGLDGMGGEGAVLVANHHSWWDGYLMWALARHHARPMAMLIDAETLERFPFFRLLGGVDAGELRTLARRARAGAWAVVFPEGRLGSPVQLAPFMPGAAAVARWAGCPLVPVGIRLVMRGRQRPEGYLAAGRALAPGSSGEDQQRAVRVLLERIDGDLAAADDPLEPPAGYRRMLRGRADDHQRLGPLVPGGRR
jgi:1-acyl-sn-glycerol-3-phosphate acyltransferase